MYLASVILRYIYEVCGKFKKIHFFEIYYTNKIYIYCGGIKMYDCRYCRFVKTCPHATFKED
ncbi:MAG: hypothetical protein ACE5KE_10905, partial [Methanosarcinales archaeon]